MSQVSHSFFSFFGHGVLQSADANCKHIPILADMCCNLWIVMIYCGGPVCLTELLVVPMFQYLCEKFLSENRINHFPMPCFFCPCMTVCSTRIRTPSHATPPSKEHFSPIILYFVTDFPCPSILEGHIWTCHLNYLITCPPPLLSGFLPRTTRWWYGRRWT